jgi:hypothetical protein
VTGGPSDILGARGDSVADRAECQPLLNVPRKHYGTVSHGSAESNLLTGDLGDHRSDVAVLENWALAFPCSPDDNI